MKHLFLITFQICSTISFKFFVAIFMVNKEAKEKRKWKRSRAQARDAEIEAQRLELEEQRRIIAQFRSNENHQDTAASSSAQQNYIRPSIRPHFQPAYCNQEDDIAARAERNLQEHYFRKPEVTQTQRDNYFRFPGVTHTQFRPAFKPAENQEWGSQPAQTNAAASSSYPAWDHYPDWDQAWEEWDLNEEEVIRTTTGTVLKPAPKK